MKALILFFSILVSTRVARAGCHDFEIPLDKALDAWKKSPVQIKASFAEDLKNTVAEEKRLDLTLQKEKGFTLFSKPRKTYVETDKAYAGYIQFSPSSSGVYTFALGKRIWIEVLDGTSHQPLKTLKFGMDAHCESIRKFVRFQLEAQKNYLVQLSSAATDQISLVISK